VKADGRDTAEASVSLGLLVTERVIKALRHACPERRAGKIATNYHARARDWTLSVADDGVGFPGDAASPIAGRAPVSSKP